MILRLFLTVWFLLQVACAMTGAKNAARGPADDGLVSDSIVDEGDDSINLVWNVIQNGDLVRPEDKIAASTFLILSGDKLCSSTLIANDLLLTAAHCMPDQDGGAVRILYGFEQPIDRKDLLKKAKRIPALSYVRHPQYRVDHDDKRGDTGIHDLALVRLNKKPPKAEAVSLPKADFNFENPQHLLIAGWGPKDKNLSEVALRNGIAEGELRLISDGIFIIFRHTYQNTCVRDSGGPVFLQTDKNRLVLIGVHTGSSGCGVEMYRAKGVSTYIVPFLTWIKEAAAQLRLQTEL